MKRLRNFYKTGDIFIWFTGFGMAVIIVMIAGLLLLVFINSTDYFYPSKIAKIHATDGKYFLDNIKVMEDIPKINLPDSLKEKGLKRYKVKIGNRDIYGLDFRWFDERNVDSITYPSNAAILERTEYGNFHSFVLGVEKDGKLLKNYKKPLNDFIDDKLSIVGDLRDEIY